MSLDSQASGSRGALLRIAACRASGFLANRLAPELIDRTEFIDKVVNTPATPAPALSLEERLRCARGDLRAGSLAAVTAERECLIEYVRELEQAPFDPMTVPSRSHGSETPREAKALT